MLKRLHWVGLAILGSCGVFVGGYRFLHAKDLLAISTSLSWKPENQYALEYAWLSQDELLTYRHTHHEWVRFNVKTGVKSVLTELTKRTLRGAPGDWYLSPDRQCLLIAQLEEESLLVSLDGSFCKPVRPAWKLPDSPVNAQSGILWFDDSQRWIEFHNWISGFFEPIPVIAGLGKAEREPHLRKLPSIVRMQQNHQSAFETWIRQDTLYALRTSKAAGWEFQTEAWESLTLSRLKLDASYRQLPPREMRLPYSAKIDEIAISPSGDRIAWVFRHQERTPWRVWLSRWFPSILGTPQERQALWISDSEGKRWKEIGSVIYVENTASEGNKSPCRLSSLAWLPDGKSVSFIRETEAEREFYRMTAD